MKGKKIKAKTNKEPVNRENTRKNNYRQLHGKVHRELDCRRRNPFGGERQETDFSE